MNSTSILISRCCKFAGFIPVLLLALISLQTPAFAAQTITGTTINATTLNATTIAGTYTGTLGAANISAGAFGSNTGGGNYTFPAALTVGSTIYANATGGNIYMPAGSYIGGVWTGAGYEFMANWNDATKGITVNLSNGNIGIGRTDPSYTLDVKGSDWSNTARIYTTGSSGGIDFWDTNGTRRGVLYSNASGFGLLNNSTGWALMVPYGTSNVEVTGNIKSGGHITQGSLVARPYAVWGVSGTSYGAVIIKLPGGLGNYGMVQMEINVYEYSGNAVNTFTCGGHNYGGLWYNYSCNSQGISDKKIRLAFKDGQYAVVIGEQGSVWSYGEVVLSKITNGAFYSGSMDLGGTYTIVQDNAAESYAWISADLNRFNARTGNFTGSLTAGSDISAGNIAYAVSSFRVNGSGNTIQDSNQFYCNNAAACYFNWSSTGVTNVGNGAGTYIPGLLSLGAGLTFNTTNPYITAPSYFIAPGGAYFNSGTVYTEAPIQARGGVHDDTHASLTLSGGTSGNTNITGTISAGGSLTFSQGSATRNVGIVGTYDPTRIAAIWSMGSGYEITAAGGAGALYGLSYSYEPDYGAVGNNPGAIAGFGHQMQWRSNGATQTAIGSGIWTNGAVKAVGNIYANNQSTYGLYLNSGVFDTVNTGGSGDPLEINYYTPGDMRMYNGDITQMAGYAIYPGAISGGATYNFQKYWYIGTHPSWGLYTNTSFNIQGVYDTGNRVYSAVNPPTAVPYLNSQDAVQGGLSGTALYGIYGTGQDGGYFSGTRYGVNVSSCNGCSVLAEMVPVAEIPKNGDVMCTNPDSGKTEVCREDKSDYLKGIAQQNAEQIMRMGCAKTLDAKNGTNSMGIGVMDTEAWKKAAECNGWYPIALSGLSEETNVVCKSPSGKALGYGDKLVTSNIPGKLRPLDKGEDVLSYQIAGKADSICEIGKETDSIKVWIQ